MCGETGNHWASMVGKVWRSFIKQRHQVRMKVPSMLEHIGGRCREKVRKTWKGFQDSMSSECEHEGEKNQNYTHKIQTSWWGCHKSGGRKHLTCESAPPVGRPCLFLCWPCPSGQQCGLCLQGSLGSNQELLLHAFLLTRLSFQAILESSGAACPF